MVAPLRTPSPPSSRPSLSLLPSATASALHLGVGQQDLRFFPAPLPPLRPLNPAAPTSAPQPTAPSAAGQQPPQPPEVVWWGTLQMCSPAAPRAHPDNQEAGPTQQQQRGKGESPWNTSSTSSTLEPQGRGPHIQHLVQSIEHDGINVQEEAVQRINKRNRAHRQKVLYVHLPWRHLPWWVSCSHRRSSSGARGRWA